ncbi:MAG: tetratricopeptide repeat protein [Myxococcales bacterium]|nr:tetratricopeptide repeat protein [Myxococcales bacterium]MCB9713943.1 tetratricopeptide repeat protein [Myxococcales bacterium]
MAGDEQNPPENDEVLLTEDEGDEAFEDDLDEEDAAEGAQAAQTIEMVVLPIACTNEGKGAPLAMGVQRWWAQELAARGAKAAAPVFTALAEQEGRKVPALMVFREPWTDERALEGIKRFPNAKRGLIANMKVDEDSITYDARLVELGKDEGLTELDSLHWEGKTEELPANLFEVLGKLAARDDIQIEHEDWKAAFHTGDHQALISFLVGLGNLSALQGRCVPTTAEQLLSPFMDAINRDPKMDPAVQGLHLMVDILVRNPIDQTAIPLCLQALNIAAQKRKDDQSLFHHLAVLFRQLGDLGSAVQAFNQAFNLDPKNGPVANQFIQTLRGAGDTANAFKVAQFAAENGNEDPGLMAHLGALMIEDDKFDEAEPFLRRAVDEGQIASAYGDLANVLWDRAGEGEDEGQAKEDRAEAMKLLRSAVRDSRLSKSTLDMLLDLHEEEKNEEATLLLLEAAEKHAGNATVLRYVATMYLEGDDPPKAREYLEKILALPRRSLDDDAFARRGLLTLDVEDFDERYDEAIEQVRSGAAAAQTEAAKFLREIITKDERFWQPHMMLALAVRETDGDGAALAHLNNAVKLRPNDVEIRNLIAAIHRKQGRPRDAVEHLRVVVALNPRAVEPVVALASCMRDANMFAEARQVCTAALQMMPNHPEFKRILESLPAPKK